MSKPKILVVWSNYHKELAEKQLKDCLHLLEQSEYEYKVETVEAGTYEIPSVINSYHQKYPFDGYIALGLVLNTNSYHYDYIMSHIKECFSQFALKNIVVGNGIISGVSMDELATKIASSDPCLSAYPSVFNAVNYLIKLKEKLSLVEFNHAEV